MDGTSTDALVAFCSCLAQSAHSTRAKIRKMTENDQLDESTGKPLQFLAIKLAQFEHHVDQLQTCLTEASTISPGLHDLVASPLPTCSNAATILTQQMEDLGPDKVGQTAGLETIRKYQELINAHQGIFILATQLLVVYVLKSP